MSTYTYARNLRYLFLILALALAFSLLLMAVNSSVPSFAQVGSVIDNFNDDQGPLQVTDNGGNDGERLWDSSTCGANCVGGEREIEVIMDDGSSPGNSITVSTSGGEYSHSSDSGIRGTSRLIYDGPDASSDVDCTGLQTVTPSANDLTFGNTVNAFQWDVLGIDASMTVSIKLYDMNDDTCNTRTEVLLFTFLPQNSPGPRYVEYAVFSLPAGAYTIGGVIVSVVQHNGGLSNMESVGAIEIDFIGSVNGDMTLDDITTNAFDWGDLLDSYDTRIIDNGPRHLIGGPQLGSAIDPSADGGEINGQPSAAADGDNTNLSGTGGTAPGPDNIGDEDGVTRLTTSDPTYPLWQAGQAVDIFVEVSGADGWVACWMDWNNNGAFETTVPSELAISQAVVIGSNTININVGAGYTTGDPLGVRCRIWSTEPGAADLLPVGRALDGEVEDYLWTHETNEVTLSEFDAASSVPVAAFAGIGVAILLLAGAGFGLARRRR